jgi:hypothetical protein
MICKCGNPVSQKTLSRGNQKHTYWECDCCGGELADGISADLLNERFQWSRVGWFQDTLRPMTFLETSTRIYDLCFLRKTERHISISETAKK